MAKYKEDEAACFPRKLGKALMHFLRRLFDLMRSSLQPSEILGFEDTSAFKQMERQSLNVHMQFLTLVVLVVIARTFQLDVDGNLKDE